MMITSFYLIICHSHGCLQPSICCLPHLKMPLILPSLDFYRTLTTTTMDTADYWLMAWEYSIWNAIIASLQFWTEELNPVTLGIATECVYTTFFYTPTSHTLWKQSDETLFWMFHYSTQCSFHPTTVTSRWRLCEWLRYHWLTNPIMKDSLHTPHFQFGTCFIQSSDHHTQQYTTNSS